MANGTIAFDTLQTSGQISGTAVSVDTDYLAYGSAKAWVRYDGTNPGSGADSLNIGSITDTGTGEQRPVFTNNMASENYAVPTLSSQHHELLGNAGGTTGTTTSTFSINTGNSSHAAADTTRVGLAVFGDLA